MNTTHPQTGSLQKQRFRRRKQLQDDLAHVTEEMYKRNKELAEKNSTLSLLQAVDSLVLKSHSELEEICSQICKSVTDLTEYPFVALLAHDNHSRKKLEIFGWSSKDSSVSKEGKELLAKLFINKDSSWLRSREQTKLVSGAQDFQKKLSNILDCSGEVCEQLTKLIPMPGVYFAKLEARQKVVGVIMIAFTRPQIALFESDSILLDRLTETVSVALDNKLLFEENQRVLSQLELSNKKLEELDEAKNDFISMASHQLRTPLTIIKGYVSMLLIGDTGKVTEKQKEVLNQAAMSAQSMNNLVTELLNVSRITSGKFVIEASEVNLADLVEHEIGQLQSFADAHKTTIAFNKPTNFPLLMLDEDKTRQVIINFIDNAVHYSKPEGGGHINVELTDKDGVVEFKVVDDGIGVPAAAQKTLFTKFFRADNAKQARPDGTGVGLYVTKEVITSQGGSLIFESKEGKGSTFGFSFVKDKLPKPKAATDSPAQATKPLTAKKPLEVKAKVA